MPIHAAPVRPPRSAPIRVLSILTFVLLGTACSGGEGWSGRMIVEDGVLNVYNPATPLWGSDWEPFEEVEVLGGGDASEEALMAQPVSVLRAPDGRRYVVDQSGSRVVIFGADGSYAGSFGRKGEGPGEFVTPSAIVRTPGGDLIVADYESGRLSRFDPEGRFLDSARYEGGVGQFEAGPDDRYYLSEQPRTMMASVILGAGGDQKPVLVKVVDPRGEPVGGFGDVIESDGVMIGIWLNKVYLAPVPGDSLAMSWLMSDRMEIRGPDGGLGRVIHRTLAFQPREPEEETQQAEGGGLSIRFQFDISSTGLAVSPDGAWIAVGTALDPIDWRTEEERQGEDERSVRWALDLFDRQGRWLARYPLGTDSPAPLLDWGEDGLYLIAPDGDAAVHRLRLREPG